jgi:hypothetical protein
MPIFFNYFNNYGDCKVLGVFASFDNMLLTQTQEY